MPPQTASGIHECSQALTLNTICLQLTDIKTELSEIKSTQKTLVDTVQLSAVERAKYPTPEKVNDLIATIGKHETFFMIGGIALVIIIGGVIDLALKIY